MLVLVCKEGFVKKGNLERKVCVWLILKEKN